MVINQDIIVGKWKQAKGRFKARWGDLIDDDLTVAEGHRDYLVGKIQERYGIACGKAEQQLRAFERDL